MYLVDTNIWLERLLDQERSAEVGQFLAQTPTGQLMMSDFISTLAIFMSGFETNQGIYAGFVTIRVNYGMSSLPYDIT